MKVELTHGVVVDVDITYDTKEIEIARRGEKLTVKKRLTILSVGQAQSEVAPTQWLLTATVSCSHKDNFSRKRWRQEAFRALLRNDTNGRLSKTDRTILSCALRIA